MLPNLSGLGLKCKRPTCLPCTPTAPLGATFEEFKDAQGSVPAQYANRSDWDPADWSGQDSPICPLCLENLHRYARNEREEGNKKVEALFEIEGCAHCFHKSCLERWVRSNWGTASLRCPTCRLPIALEVLQDLWDPSNPTPPVQQPVNDNFVQMVQQQQAAANGYDDDDDGGDFVGRTFFGDDEDDDDGDGISATDLILEEGRSLLQEYNNRVPEPVKEFMNMFENVLSTWRVLSRLPQRDFEIVESMADIYFNMDQRSIWKDFLERVLKYMEYSWPGVDTLLDIQTDGSISLHD